MAKQNGKGGKAAEKNTPVVETPAAETTEKSKDGIFLARVHTATIKELDKDGKPYVNKNGQPEARMFFNGADGKSYSLVVRKSQIFDAQKLGRDADGKSTAVKDPEFGKTYKNILLGKADAKIQLSTPKEGGKGFDLMTVTAADVQKMYDDGKKAYKAEKKAEKAAEKAAAKDDVQADAPDAI